MSRSSRGRRTPIDGERTLIVKYFRKHRGGFDLERELRANRPQPSDELIRKLEGEVYAAPAARARGSLRLALVGAVTAVVFAVASVGGVGGYAAAAVGNVADTAKRVVTPSKPATIFKSAAQQQYGGSAPKKKVKAKKKKAKKAKPRFTGGVKGRPRFTG